VLQLLAGVQRPNAGRVLVVGPAGEEVPTTGDCELSDVDPQLWRKRVAWAAQGGAMQAGSIRDNLALGSPGIDETTLRAALEAADASRFVDALPNGWHTSLGEGGAGISQGQRQRLALARALARPAGVLLLDEPTAALDEPTEQRVLEGIARVSQGRTVVLVTHRPAPVALADHLITLSRDPARAHPESTESLPGDDEPTVEEAEPLTVVGPW
jgi:ABC-type bacteriocin/lantibiotic exporter with double-glycine peptidase domain